MSQSQEGEFNEDDQHLLEELRAQQEELDAQSLDLQIMQKELKEYSEKYRDLFESIPMGCLALDDSLRIMEANPACASLFGTKLGEIVGSQIYQFAPESSQTDLEAHFFSARENGECVSQIAFKRKDGSKIFAEIKTSHRENKTSSFHTVIQDITANKEAEKALGYTAQKYSALFDTTSDGVWIHNLKGEIREVNDAYCRMSGYTREELIGMPISVLEALESVTEIFSHMERVVQSGGHDKFESKHRRKDGSLFDVDITALYLEREGGQMAMFVRDITKRKEAEAKAQREHRQLLSIFDSMDEVVYIVDPETYELLYTNDFFLRTWGEGIGKKCYKVLQNREAPCSFCTNDRIFGDHLGETHIWESKNELTRQLYRYIDRAIEWPDGRLVRVEMAIDITESKRAEEELKASQERFKAFMNNTPGIAWMKDSQGRYVYLSKTFEDRFGVKLEDWQGKTDFEVWPQEVAEKFRKNDQQVLEVGRTMDTVEETPDRDGGTTCWLTYRFPFWDAAGNKYIGGIGTDITERKRAEEDLKRSNAELQQFAYIASHDLREPLRMVSSYLDLLEKKYEGRVLDEKAKEYIDYAVDGADRMQQLINDILTYSRVETRGETFSRVDMNDVLETALKDLGASIEESGALLTHNNLPLIMADQTQMVLLLENLIGNAIKFRRSEIPQITITVGGGSGLWIFSIRDNGIGIPKEQQKRLFQMFQRLHTRDDYPGTGIGLAISKKIVERHGGRIWVESEEGRGSTFFFTIPVRRRTLESF